MAERIYFDNAATTPLDPQVLEAMMPYLTEKFGNPSSIYSYGREAKMGVEQARKTIAKILGCAPGEVFFTSGGTESSNTAIYGAVRDLGCTHIITSPIEHHATLHTVEAIQASGAAKVHYCRILPNGHLDLDHFSELLQEADGKVLVTLMHANNEIGNLADVEAIGKMCEAQGAIFHCDMVQTIGHYPIDLSKLHVHFASAAGHKFHGPKGIGLLYIRGGIRIQPLLQGGAQERNMRAGTENLYGAVGFAKALELAAQTWEADMAYIRSLKQLLWDGIQHTAPGARLFGDPFGRGLYTVLNVGFPKTEKTEMLLFSLDMAGVCVSGGSACSSGASGLSHVIAAIDGGDYVPIRFSLSRHNTPAEVEQVISLLQRLVNAHQPALS